MECKTRKSKWKGWTKPQRAGARTAEEIYRKWEETFSNSSEEEDRTQKERQTDVRKWPKALLRD